MIVEKTGGPDKNKSPIDSMLKVRLSTLPKNRCKSKKKTLAKK